MYLIFKLPGTCFETAHSMHQILHSKMVQLGMGMLPKELRVILDDLVSGKNEMVGAAASIDEKAWQKCRKTWLAAIETDKKIERPC
jgi:hypothetical protein